MTTVQALLSMSKQSSLWDDVRCSGSHLNLIELPCMYSRVGIII